MNIQTMLKVSVCFNSVLIFIVLYGISSGIVTHLPEEIKVVVFLIGVATFVQYCYIEKKGKWKWDYEYTRAVTQVTNTIRLPVG